MYVYLKWLSRWSLRVHIHFPLKEITFQSVSNETSLLYPLFIDQTSVCSLIFILRYLLSFHVLVYIWPLFKIGYWQMSHARGVFSISCESQITQSPIPHHVSLVFHLDNVNNKIIPTMSTTKPQVIAKCKPSRINAFNKNGHESMSCSNTRSWTIIQIQERWSWSVPRLMTAWEYHIL